MKKMIFSAMLLVAMLGVTTQAGAQDNKEKAKKECCEKKQQCDKKAKAAKACCDKKEKTAKACCDKKEKAGCGQGCQKCTECKADCSKTNCKDCKHKGDCKKNCKK